MTSHVLEITTCCHDGMLRIFRVSTDKPAAKTTAVYDNTNKKRLMRQDTDQIEK